jgi:CubicO group peptidase (beta-lactamase class C family)
VGHWDLAALAGAGGLRSTVDDLLAFPRLQLGDGPPALVRAAALTRVVQTCHRGVAIGLAWTQLPLLGTDHEVLFHNGGTGGFRSFAAFVPATYTGVVVLSNSARSVDALGFRILKRISLTTAIRAKRRGVVSGGVPSKDPLGGLPEESQGSVTWARRRQPGCPRGR